MNAKLLEIASRIHCPNTEGGKYAAGIKSELEALAREKAYVAIHYDAGRIFVANATSYVEAIAAVRNADPLPTPTEWVKGLNIFEAPGLACGEARVLNYR